VPSWSGASRTPPDRSISFFVLLALLTLLPAAFVLWFMNEAIATQTAAAQRSLLESYRGQLRLVRPRIDAHWRALAGALGRTGTPEQRFAGLILDGVADGAVVLGADGHPSYPTTKPDFPASTIEQHLAEARRLAAGRARDASVERAAALLNDYATPLPASQRLDLMSQLRALESNVMLPTEAALRLSMEYAGAGLSRPELDAPGVFHQTGITDVWALRSDDQRVIVLHRTGRLESMMHDVLHQVAPAGILFVAWPPGLAGDEPEAIPAGASLPGWQLSFEPLDMMPFVAASLSSERQVVMYGVVAFAGISAIVLLGVGAARTFRRNIHLTRLKTDLVSAVSHELRTPLASMRVLVDGLLADEQPGPEKTREYLGLLAAEQARLGRLIENFLTFSRAERGQQPFVFTATRPSSIVSAAVEAIRDRIPDDCDFRVSVADDLPQLIGDAEALTTALVNLLDNALKYARQEADRRAGVSRRPRPHRVTLRVPSAPAGATT
jgi:signal transduction histidine kinase